MNGCYLCQPDNPDADEEACAACDRAYWENPVYIVEDCGGPDDDEFVARPALARTHNPGNRAP